MSGTAASRAMWLGAEDDAVGDIQDRRGVRSALGKAKQIANRSRLARYSPAAAYKLPLFPDALFSEIKVS